MKKPISLFLAATATVALAAGLSACSSDGKTSTPTASPTKSAVADGKAPKTAVCENGVFLIAQKDLTDKKFTVTGDCDTIAVLTNDAKITIDADIKSLSLEGSKNTIESKKIGSIAVLGQGNTVTHTGEAPTVADTGRDDDTVYNVK